MIGFFLGMLFLSFTFWLGFKVTGALLKAFFWLFIIVPLVVLVWGIGLVCFCTILLIPVGVWLFKTGFKMLLPGI